MKASRRKPLAKAVKVVEFLMVTLMAGLQLSGIEDKLGDILMRKVNTSAKAVILCLKTAEGKMAGPSPVVI